MRRAIFSITTAIFLLSTAAVTVAQDHIPYGEPVQKSSCKSGPDCGNTDVPDYITPGNFKKALKKSKKTNRPLLIKGVAFGMNKTGAKKPTKGNW